MNVKLNQEFNFDFNLERETYFMSQAVAYAQQAFEIQEVPVGCVIVRNNKIIAHGFNRRNANQNALAHAEIIAINQACTYLKSWLLDDCDLYVTLEPCAMCAGAILQARIKRLIFGAFNLKFGCAGSIINLLNQQKFNHRVKKIF